MLEETIKALGYFVKVYGNKMTVHLHGNFIAELYRYDCRSEWRHNFNIVNQNNLYKVLS